MYCKNCGKQLDDDAKFCSNCGARVETEEPVGFVTSGSVDSGRETKKPRKPFHIEEFNWDLDGYPTEQRKKTEDVNFDWAPVLEEQQRRLFDEATPEEEPEQENPTTWDISDLDRPTIRGDKFNWDLELNPRPKVIVPIEPEEFEEQDDPIDQEEQEDTSAPLEEILFADAGMGARVDKPTKIVRKNDGDRTQRIDGIYTFSKKNEEFQALLEKEYEKINGDDGEEPEELPAEDESLWIPIEIDSEVEAMEQEVIQEPEPIPEPEPVESEPEPIAEPEPEPVEADVLPDDSFVGVTLSQPPVGIMSDGTAVLDDMGLENTKLTFEQIFSDDDDDDDEEEKPKKRGGGFLKVLAVILCILVIVELIIIGIQFFAPESGAGKFINNSYQYVINLISGNDGEDDGDVLPVSSFTDEISALINANIDKNENIAAVSADGSLTFEDGEDYGFDELNNAYTFADSTWYQDDDGNDVTYGSSVVGTVIGYYSAWIDKANGKNDEVLEYIDDTSDFYGTINDLQREKGVEHGINSLKIGEIKSGSSGVYLMASVASVASNTTEETVLQQVVFLQPAEKAMKIADIKTI